MNQMLSVTLTFCLTLVVGVLGTSDPVLNSDLYSDVHQHGKTFTADVTFQSRAASRLQCAALCSQRGEECRTFTFDGVTCTGHGADVTPDTTFIVTPDAQTFGKMASAPDPVNQTCLDVEGSQVAVISLEDGSPLRVFCDDGWTVFQRRRLDNEGNGLDFNRNWADYQKGFGDVNGEFWLGLEAVHRLTRGQQMHGLRVKLTFLSGGSSYTDFVDFKLGNRSTLYPVSYERIQGAREGYLPKQPFSTYDRGASQPCANSTGGGWWLEDCQLPDNLNGASPRWGPYSEGVQGTEMKFFSLG